MSGKALEVLVVEDDDDARKYVSDLLRAEGYDVTTAGDGLEALAYASVGTFDVIVTDFRMPEMDGLELLHGLRVLCPRANTILLSAFADVNTCIEAFHLGAVAHIKKPFKREELIDAVEKARPKAESNT